MSNLFRNVNDNISEEDIRMMNPISLAFVGDAVYELLMRTRLLHPNKNSNKLHRITSSYVNAKSQSKVLNELESHLTDEEMYVIRRGRNAKSHTVPKNADLRDYKNSTALEALFGYLYLLDREDRISELFNFIWRDEI